MEDGDLLLDRLLEAVAKWKRAPIQKSLTWQSFEEFLEDVKNPKPEEVAVVPEPPLKEFVLPPAFPRLLVSYDPRTGAPVEYIVVNNFSEWNPYHSWFSVFPPTMNRREVTSLEAEVEKLKADGLKERPKEDFERRKQAAKK